VRSILIVPILAALIFAQLYSWWPNEVVPTDAWVAETKGYVNPYFVSFVWENGRQFELWHNIYVFTASVLTPSGEIKEQYYKKAIFLVEIPSIDPQRDVKWYSPWEDGKMQINYGIGYVFIIPIKIGEGPLYNWTLVPSGGLVLG